MNDDRIDELLQQAARDYNEPGPVPRDEIWSRIQRARAEQTAPAVEPGRSRNRIWVWPGLGIAAALLLSTGIVIGRRLERSHDSPERASTAPVSTSSPAPALAAAPPRGSIAEPPAPSTPRTADSRPIANSDLAYQLVVLQHLAGTEAMITAFRASADRGKTDTLVTDWSRQLLGTTRLLAASPAANDPGMRRLLQDLDFVITEIVQYSDHGVNNPDELRLIEQSIDQRSVIAKLRGTIPSRRLPAGT